MNDKFSHAYYESGRKRSLTGNEPGKQQDCFAGNIDVDVDVDECSDSRS